MLQIISLASFPVETSPYVVLSAGQVLAASDNCTDPTPAEIYAVVKPRMTTANRVTGAMGTSQEGTKPIYVYDLDRAGTYKGQYYAVISSMAIDTDGSDSDPDPDHQSQTTFQDAQGRHLGSKHVPFWVIDDVATSLPNFPWGSKFNMNGFQVGTMIYPASRATAGSAKMIYGVLGDTQGSENDIEDLNHVGEASQFAAAALGIGTSGTTGGVDGDVMYVFSTGTKNRVIPSNGYTGTNATLTADAARAGKGWMCQMLADLGGGSNNNAATYVLTVNGGTGSGSYASGAKVNIPAGAAPSGQTFDKWIGDTAVLASATAASKAVTMPAKNTTVTATFKAAENEDDEEEEEEEDTTGKYPLHIFNGTGSGSYDAGAKVTITANGAFNGMVFDRWLGATNYISSATSKTATVTMPGKSIMLSAYYKVAGSDSEDDDEDVDDGEDEEEDDSATIKDGSIIRAKSSIDVYIIKLVNGKKFKRLILSPSVFRSYGHLKWSDIIIVEPAELSAYTTSSLVRLSGSSQVWKLAPYGDTGKKTAVTGSYDPDSVYEVNATDFASYAQRAS